MAPAQDFSRPAEGAQPSSSVAMDLVVGRTVVYLDPLVLSTILDGLDARSLASMAATSKGTAKASQEVAADGLLVLLKVRVRGRTRHAPALSLANHALLLALALARSASVCCPREPLRRASRGLLSWASGRRSRRTRS